MCSEGCDWLVTESSFCWLPQSGCKKDFGFDQNSRDPNCHTMTLGFLGGQLQNLEKLEAHTLKLEGIGHVNNRPSTN